jgi:hypothetical protein
MAKFSALELDMFVEVTCSRCFQPDEAAKRVLGSGDGCPLLKRARNGQMPGKWTRRRGEALGSTFKCAEYAPSAPTARRKRAVAEDVPMFDPEPVERLLVPIEGWPDYAAEARRQRDGDHQ